MVKIETICWYDNNGILRKEYDFNPDPRYNLKQYFDENGDWHRLNGPARILYGNGEWWYHGTYITNKSQKEFEKLIKLKAFW